MKATQLSIVFVFLSFFLLYSMPETNGQAGDKIPSEQLLEDFPIFKSAYKNLHPGLYRHVDSVVMERHFDQLEQSFQRDLTLAEAYLEISRMLTAIKDGHTYANFYNQPKPVRKQLFDGKDLLPFTFWIVDKRMYVNKNASKEAKLTKGTEILSIDGRPVEEILAKMFPYVRGDGNSDHKKYSLLEVSGEGQFETFDIFFPLLFPFQSEKVEVKVKEPDSKAPFTCMLSGISKEKRKEILVQRYGKLASSPDDLWSFEVLSEELAYLQLGSFVTWKMTLNWKKFLQDAFREIKKKEIPNLILDIRGNEGGSDEVLMKLGKYILKKPIVINQQKEYLKYEEVPEELAPYLSTWDESIKNMKGKVRPLKNGMYTWKNHKESGVQLPASTKAYQGQIYLLVGAANSSATFNLAKICKNEDLAILVGQETGGNLKGTTGGMMFFLTLPNTQIACDIPLVASFPLNEQPDCGLQPDVYVQPKIQDKVNGVDAEVEAVKNLIRSK